MWKCFKGRQILLALLVLTISFLVPSWTSAQRLGSAFVAAPLAPESIYDVVVKKPMVGDKIINAKQQGLTSIIVKLKGEPLITYKGGIPGLAPTDPRITGVSQLDVKSYASQEYLGHLAKKHANFETTILKAIPKAKITHRYTVIVNGMAIIMPSDQIEKLANLPDVETIYLDELLQPDTDNSPQFIGATTVWNQLGGQESAGEGVVVGVLDTGIWPEHQSFSDPDPSGKPYPAPPAPLSGPRACQFSGGSNPGGPFTCNNKLIGAQRFMATYDVFQTLTPGEFTSARDNEGHGTHTSSTAAGNATVSASIYGISRGFVSGIAPRAHVIMYKVCGIVGCYSSDSAAATQQAILDGVNVINFSISGGSNPYSDVVELAFLDAYNAGVFVSASAGNSGPSPDTTDHRGPWVTTVAATSQNRAFETTATVTSIGGSMTLTATSITGGILSSKMLVVPADPLCGTPLAAGTVADMVVVCRRGTQGRAEKGYNVLQGGAAGMILYNQAANVTDLETDNHYLPTVHIQYDDGQALLAFLSAHADAQVTWPAGSKVTAQGDVMASFSSRGGPGQTIGVSKPDIAAPGVQILAGHTPSPVGVANGPQGELFQAIAGTSMASPHIAGAGALLKALRPTWTPGKIKSALMTTAYSGVVKEDGTTYATPFDQGSGRVDLTRAGTVGLTFDETRSNYQLHENDLWNANHPSIYVPSMPGIITVQRTVYSEVDKNRSWKTSVETPADVTITVPKKVKVPKGGSATFPITINGETVPLGQTRHATLKLTYKEEEVRVPITFVRGQPEITIAKMCDPETIPQKGTTNCTITMQNNTFVDANVSMSDVLPKTLKMVKDSAVGGIEIKKGVSFEGSLYKAEPPDVSMGTGSSPGGGYLALSLFGISPIAGMGDDTIINFNVPAFTYAGETYTRLGVVSNGYIVVGGGTASDVMYINQSLPNSVQPNNVLAPFWTDLSPAAGGAIRIGALTDGADSWIVVDWEAVREFSTIAVNSFQIWIGESGDANPGEDISFAYGAITGNGNGALTVGAENKFGTRGANYYYNGTGTLPAEGMQLRVTGIPLVPGESRTVTYSATGKKVGDWTNCAEMTGDIFFGTNASCFSGHTISP